MSPRRAVLAIDHQQARFAVCNEPEPAVRHLHAHAHPTGQHHSEVRSEHEFFGKVCDAIDSVDEALIVGSHGAVADFHRYAEKHRPATAKRVIGDRVVDRLTDRELIANGQAFYAERAHLKNIGAVPDR